MARGSRFVVAESNATSSPPADTEESVLAPLPGTGGLALFTESSIGNWFILMTRKLCGVEVLPEAPGFVIETGTVCEVATAEEGTCT